MHITLTFILFFYIERGPKPKENDKVIKRITRQVEAPKISLVIKVINSVGKYSWTWGPGSWLKLGFANTSVHQFTSLYTWMNWNSLSQIIKCLISFNRPHPSYKLNFLPLRPSTIFLLSAYIFILLCLLQMPT